MTSLEIAKELLEEYDGISCSEVINITEEDILTLQRDLKILDLLKYRIHLKEDTIKGAHFTINEKGLPEIENDTKDCDIVWVEASGFVFRNSDEYKLLKEWLENDK